MSTRLRKQITYGIGFIVVLVGAIWLGRLVFGPSAPAPTVTPSPTDLFQKIVLEEASIIQHAAPSATETARADIVIRLRNPNPRAGIKDYPVTARLLDGEGRLIREETIATYILPGAIAYAMRVNIETPVPAAKIEVTLPAFPQFLTVPASVSLPAFSVVQQGRATREIGKVVFEEQKWLLRNESPLDWQFVEVVGAAQDAAGRVIGIGQTFVGELRVGESREVTLQWPATAAAPVRVIVLPTTNIYKEENIVRAIGDPGLLR